VEEIKVPRVLNNEIVLLVTLSVVAFGVFVFTRHMAAKDARLEARIAAVWYERGVEAIRSGDTAKAVESFRKATAQIGDSQKYMLALANALAAENNDAEAQQLLLRLREPDPENVEINLHLARLAAKRGAVQEAVHYYRNALYGRWADDESVERRNMRLEFVRFLVDHRRRELASAELLVLQGQTPNSAAAHVEVAKLFRAVGDELNALKEYQEALQLDGQDVEALTGAGEISFHMANYDKAQQYLRAALGANPQSQETRQLLTLTGLVLNEDPLTSHISPVERQKRLLSDMDLSVKRLEACIGQTSEGNAVVEMQSLKTEATAMEPTLKSGAHPPDSDAAKSGVDLIFRMQQAASASCGKPELEDEALLLIGRQHAGERQ
jgi:tetratricopeptide (TPR) repeat protein